jgi:hypothetical protein
MECRVTVADTQTIVESIKRPFKMSVVKDKAAPAARNTALLEATLYKEDGSFIRQCSYLFEALDANNQPLNYVDVDDFKTAVDLYFTEVLATEYYVKSIPRASSLCHSEMQKFNF